MTSATPSTRRADLGATSRVALAQRIGLLLVAVAQAEVAIWGLVAPRSFFVNFPGDGHHWVSALGPYNEHLVRDYAATELGFAVLMVAAAVWFERKLVLIAGGAFLAGTIPHFVYHLTTTGSFSTTDNLASLGSFVLELVLVAAAMLTVARAPLTVARGPGSASPGPDPIDRIPERSP